MAQGKSQNSDLNPVFADKVKLVFTKKSSKMYSVMSVNVLRECCLYLLGDMQRPIVFSGNKVCFLDTSVGLWKDLFHLDFEVWKCYEYSALFLHVNLLFVCGIQIHPSKCSAFLLSQEALQPLPNLQTPRVYCGVAPDWRNEVVYVFGGMSERSKLSTCESFTLATSTWTALQSPMSVARSHFNPCKFFYDIFLAGGTVNSVEVFHSSSSTFEMTTIELPSDFKKGGCCAVVKSDTLIVLCRTALSSWDLRTHMKKEISQHSGIRVLPRCWPILRSRTIYLVDWSLVCYAISAESGELESKYEFKP